VLYYVCILLDFYDCMSFLRDFCAVLVKIFRIVSCLSANLCSFENICSLSDGFSMYLTRNILKVEKLMPFCINLNEIFKFKKFVKILKNFWPLFFKCFLLVFFLVSKPDIDFPTVIVVNIFKIIVWSLWLWQQKFTIIWKYL